MRQRNTADHTLTVWSIPADVAPGEVVDWPDPICGFEPVDDEPVAPAADAADAAKKTPAKTTKAASPAADAAKEATQQ